MLCIYTSGIPWNVPRVTCIFWCTHKPLVERVYQEDTSDKYIHGYSTRKRCITML